MQFYVVNCRRINMGNTQHNGQYTSQSKSQDKKTCQESSTDEDKLTACFSRLADLESNNQVSLATLKIDLMPSCPRLADNLVSAFNSEGQDHLTQAAFVKFGKQLIEAGQNPNLLQDVLLQLFVKPSEQINRKDAVSLLQCCHQVAWSLARYPIEEIPEDDATLMAFLGSMFGQEEQLSQEDLSVWCGRHNPWLFQTLHQYLTMTFLGNTASNQLSAASVLPEPLAGIQAGKYCLTTGLLWALNGVLPHIYAPSGTSQQQHNSWSSASVLLTGLAAEGSWTILYNSNDQGLSVNRFLHHVMDYKGPTVTVLSFEAGMFCIALDQEWRQSGQRWGGSDCCLIQLVPQFRKVMAGENMLYLNIQDRSVPKGLQVGKDMRTLVLQTDEGLTKVKYYGIEYDLHRLEVWGCGGSRVREAQINQKQWEHQEAVKSKDRKLKLEDWKNNPDRELLNMGGVTTEHAQR